MARAGGSEPQARPEGHAGPAGGVQRHHQVGRHRGDGQSARTRHGAGQGLPRPPRPGLSRRLHPLAGVVAQAAGRPLGRSGAVGRPAHRRRPRVGDRTLPHPGVLDRRGRGRRRQRSVHRPPRQAPEQAPHQVRPRRRGQRRGGPRGGQGRDLQDHGCRAQARSPLAAAALHHLQPATGSLTQARLQRSAHHAGRPEAVRGHRHRRRDRWPHHLHAHRRRSDRARGP